MGQKQSVKNKLKEVLVKKNDTELFEYEHKFHIVIDNSSDVFYSLNEQTGQFLYISPSCENVVGYSSRELMAQDNETSLKMVHPDDLHLLMEMLKTLSNTGKATAVYRHRTKKGDYRWLSNNITQVPTKDGTHVRCGCLRDITDIKNKEKELLRLNRTLRALSNSNHALLHAEDEKTLLRDVCKIINNDCNYPMVWIGFAENDKTKSVCPVVYSGFEEGYLNTLQITWADEQRGRGPTGKSIRTGKTCFCRNMLTDSNFIPWREQALKRGYTSSIAIPLISNGDTFGALTIYSSEPDPFSENEVELLEELTNDLAKGISTIRLSKINLEAEKKLKETEERFRNLFESLSSGVAIYDVVDSGKSFIFKDMNSAGQRINHIKREDIIGKNLIEIFPYAGEMGIVDLFQRVWRTGTPEFFPVSQYKDSKINFWVTNYVYCLPSGELVAVFNDITEHKQIEDKLRQSQLLYEELVNNARSVIIKQDTEGRVTFINDYGETVFGYKSEELIGKSAFGLIVPEVDSNGNKTDIMLENIYNNPDNFQININENINKKGDRFWFEWHNKALFDETGKRTGHITVGIDVTDRIKSEKQKNYLASFPRLSVTPIIELGINGQINYINPSASDLFPDLRTLGVKHPLLKEINTNTLDQNQSYNREVCVDNKWFKQTINHISEMNSFRIYNTDITAIKLMGQRQRNFLAILGHELRNPLATILLLLDILEPKLTHDLESQETFNKIKYQSQNVSDLVKDLLDISRIEMGRIEIKTQKTNIAVSLRNAAQGVKSLLDNNKQTLEMVIPTKEVFVMADSLRLEQIIVNLLNNASKFSSKNSYIKLSLETNDDQAIIKVKDFGIGIANKSILRIFELFSQEDNYSDQKNDGLGIGLYLSSQLVRLHGGSITCYSDGIGRGSEFVIKIPRLKNAKEHKSKEIKPNSKSPSKIKVLVIDDNIALVETLECAINSLGFDVKTCTDGKTALKLIKNCQFDIALIDLGMPIMDGLTLAKKIKAIKNSPTPTLIAITGYGQETDKDLARNAGFNNYVIKPIGIHELSKILLSKDHHF